MLISSQIGLSGNKATGIKQIMKEITQVPMMNLFKMFEKEALKEYLKDCFDYESQPREKIISYFSQK